MQKTCIVIAGPTAVGKTAVAIEVARRFNTAIISADSRQCFKEMSIGVAKPSPEELQQVHHYFINSHSIHDDVNAAVFEQYALQAASEIFQQNDVAVVTGGTGLYIKAFCEGLDDMPPVSPALRQSITEQYEQKGLPLWLQPVHIRLLPVGNAFVDACKELVKKYERSPLRIEIDDRSISLSSKLKAAHKDLIPYKVAIGQKEINSNYAEFNKFIEELAKQVEGKPFIQREWPMEVGRQLS